MRSKVIMSNVRCVKTLKQAIHFLVDSQARLQMMLVFDEISGVLKAFLGAEAKKYL